MPPEVPDALKTPTTGLADILKCFPVFGLDMAPKAISTLEFNAAMIAYQ